MNEEILKELYETFNLKERVGTGGMKFKYVPNEDVINRMNKVFKGNWSTKVMDKDIVDDQVIVEVQVDVIDPDTNVEHIHTGFGSQQIMRYNSGPNAGKIIDIGNAYKGALAKAIVNACTRWGVGLFKERNPYEMDNITLISDNNSDLDSVPVMASRPMPMPAPNSAPTKSMPAPRPMPVASVSAPSPAVRNVPAARPMPAPPNNIVVAPAPTIETTKFTPAPPAPNQTVSASINVSQAPIENKSETMPMPKMPSPSLEAPRPVPKPTTEAPTTPTLPMGGAPVADNNGLDKIGISDVQRVALNGILSMNKVEYEPLAREAFDSKGMAQPVPPKSGLTYEEAVVVIKYGNDKFRKNR
jgi:hypothetical protein